MEYSALSDPRELLYARRDARRFAGVFLGGVVPWLPIGKSRRVASALPTEPADAFWRTALTNVVQHQKQKVPTDLLAYPNCYLYSKHRDPVLACFLFATPFAHVALLPLLHDSAVRAVGGAYLHFELQEVPDADGYKIYRVLAMRIELMARMCQDAQEKLQSEMATEARRHTATVLCEWLDAHLMMAIAIKELGYVPRDMSAEMQIILAKYAPNYYMALREADLPDMSGELERCDLFSFATNNHKEDAFTELFSKALPRRCDPKEMAAKVADVCATHTGFYSFIKLMLAATYLGLYSHSTERAPLAVRFVVYRLFFFEFDFALRQFATSRPTPGTGASVRQQFDLSALAGSLREQFAKKMRTRVAIEIQYTSYQKSAAFKYTNSTERKEKQAAAAAAPVPGAKRRKTLSAALSSRSDIPSTIVWTPEQHEKACQPNARAFDGESFVQHTTFDIERGLGFAFCNSLFAANAMTRLVYERNCGMEVYEQRKANGTIADSGIRTDDGQPVLPPPPVAPNTPIDYAEAIALALPCDHALPSDARIQADAIIYEWLTTVVVSFDTSPTKSGRRTTVRKKKTEYVFQHFLMLSVRQYILFAMRRWCGPMHQKLCERVAWLEWEKTIITSAAQFCRDVATPFLHNDVPKDTLPALLLTQCSAYMAIAERTVINHYDCDPEPFLDVLLEALAIKSRGYTVTKPDGVVDERAPFDEMFVDHVLPRETELLLRHSLRYWKYSKCESGSVTSGDGLQLPFSISPVALSDLESLPADGIVPSAYINEFLVSRARYPLSIFHATDLVISKFNECEAAYYATKSQAHITTFLDWLGSYSVYQYQLIYAFCRAVNRHMRIDTFVLPRHIVEHQKQTLRNQHLIPATQPVPPHLLRALVCVGCAHIATFFPPAANRQSTLAFGNDEIRILTTPSDDETVFASMRARGALPLACDELMPANSWLEVMYHRTRNTPPTYDRYSTHSREASDVELGDPAQVGRLPLEPTEQDFVDRAQRIFGGSRCESADTAAPVYDRRADIGYDMCERDVAMVARGRGRLGELAFAQAMWREVDRRVMAYGGMAGGEKSFLLMGHAMPQNDAAFGTMRFACKSHHIRSENKKSKNLVQQHARAEASAPDAPNGADGKRDNYRIRRCRDAHSNMIYACCTRELMYEVDYLGRALYFTTLDSTKRVVSDATDFVIVCCDCLAATRSENVRVIADRMVCTPCYHASRACGGSVALRVARGESTKTAATAAPNALSGDALNAVHDTARQALFSPSYSVLCNEVVGADTVCVMDQCKAVKTADSRFFGLEVLRDTDVGNETYAFVYFCSTHARLYRHLFTTAVRLPLSTLRFFMADNKRSMDDVIMHGNFLDSIMRGEVHASDHKTQVQITEKFDTQKRTVSQQRRKQRKIATVQSALETSAAERDQVSRVLDDVADDEV